MINVRKLKRKWENVSKNNKMIFLLLCCLCFITVGYAAINQVLKIAGSASIDKGDGMIFTSIGLKENNNASIETDASIKAKTLVNTQIGFTGEGSITFQVSAQNQGTTDAKLIEIKGLNEHNTKEPTCIKASVQDHNIGDLVYPNQVKNFTITITSTCASYSSKEFDLHFVYEKQETINGSLPTLGNAVEYLINNKVSTDINTSPTNGLFAIGNNGELTTSTSPREYRYIGADPDNYIQFNNELWRIIGIFDGQLKIIRNESLGNMQWDSNNVNDWSTASLQNYLNNDYYGTIDSNDQTKIDSNYVWKLGGSSTNNDVTAQMFYERERGTTVYSGRPTEWTGSIALMYPSDYGFSTSGGSTTNRSSCLAKKLIYWNSVEDCYTNSWLYDSSSDQWTLVPRASYSNIVFRVYSGGNVGGSFYATGSSAVRPAVYLLSNVEIVSGDGTSSSPFILG